MMNMMVRAVILALLLALMPTATHAQPAEAQEAQVLEARAILAAQVEVEDAVEEAAEAVGEATDQATDDAGDDKPADAADDASDEEDDTTELTSVVEEVPPGTMRFHLMDGSIITGRIANESLPIKTQFGSLTVPVEKIESFSPGLASHPKLDQRIQDLIQRLGSPKAVVRDKAQSELASYGQGLIPELQRHADDPDAERKVRVATIIENLFAQEGEDDPFLETQGPQVSLERLDAIITNEFTMAGTIQQKTFEIESKYGKLSVALEDIKAVEKFRTRPPEIRQALDISGQDMTCKSYKKTRIRLSPGDRVIVIADGSINMSPWGSRTYSTPDGTPNNGMYQGNIPMGALAGKIGDSGTEFMIGSKHSFVAQRAGTLQLGFAMQPNWANYQFPGKYEVRIRVVPAE